MRAALDNAMVPRRKRPWLRVWPCAAAALLATGGAWGCGGSSPRLDTHRVERAITASILDQGQIHTTVSCPDNVPRKQGTVFTCFARLEVGVYPVRVTETNDSGHVRYGNSSPPLVVLDIDRVQRAIERSMLQQRHLHATVRCPSEVLRRAGLTFTCEAAFGGKRHPFSVTQLDNHGGLRYAGQR